MKGKLDTMKSWYIPLHKECSLLFYDGKPILYKHKTRIKNYTHKFCFHLMYGTERENSLTLYRFITSSSPP